MYNIKITICYDGSSFNGWQRQDNTDNTIQQHLETAIEKVIGEQVKLDASGRTDAGVHALAQTANFKCSKYVNDLEQFIQMVNEYTSESVKLTGAYYVSKDFHSRLSAKSKTYSYNICILEKPRVFKRHRVYIYGKELDVEKMKRASKLFCGQYDFRAFSSEKDNNKSTIRQIWDIEFIEEEGMIKIIYHGNGFLYNMVRIITGTLIEVGNAKMKEEDIIRCFKTKDRKDAGFMAPACGLMLMSVEYDKE